MKDFLTAGSILGAGFTGAILALALNPHVPASTVHAQERFTTLAGCRNSVPKIWGTFMGASE